MRLAFFALALIAARTATAGTGFPAGFSETTYATGVTYATSMAWAPDGSNRLFVTRQGQGPGGALRTAGGEVRIIKNGALLATPFATVAPGWFWSEAGLLGLTFDPDFASN